MNLRSWPRQGRGLAVAVFLLAGGLFLSGEGCDPAAPYTRLPGSGGEVGPGGTGSGGTAGAGTGGVVGTGGTGTGGVVSSTGGAAGGKGGAASGGSGGAGGQAPGSGGAAGAATGGQGTGGMGTGGAATGGGGAGGKMTGSGGVVGSGGMSGSGGAATGGAGGGGKGGTAGGGVGGAAQRIISIDFEGGVISNGTITPTPMAATERAGVKAATHWNEAAGAASSTALTPLVQSDGTSLTGSGVTWSSPGDPNNMSINPGVFSAGLTDMAGDVRMMNGYLDPSSGSAPAATVTVSGLGALTGGYDVYVYFLAQLSSGTMRTHKVTIGSTTVSVTQVGPSGFTGYSEATNGGTTGNYVLFKNVTGTSFTMTSTAVSASDSIMRAPVNGMQIVWPSGS